MKKGLLFGLVSVGFLFANPAFAALKNIEAFNADFVLLLNNKPTSEAMRDLSKNPAITQAKTAIKNSDPKLNVFADGKKICSASSSVMLCWSPVVEKSQLGILFDGNKTAFFSKAKTYEQWEKDFNKFLKVNKKQSWYSLIIPEAQAQTPVDNADIAMKQGQMIFATHTGWVWYDSAPAAIQEKMAKWPDNYVDGQAVVCRSKGAAFSIARDNKLDVTTLKEGEYIVKTAGKTFKAVLAQPANYAKCKAGWYRGDDVGIYDACKRARGVYNIVDSTAGYTTDYRIKACYDYGMACKYSIPQSPLLVQICADEECTKMSNPTMQDESVLYGDSKNAAEIKRLEGAIAGIYPEADFTMYSITPPRENNLSGKSLAELEDLNKSRRELVKANTEQAGALKEHLVNAAIASRCCDISGCRQGIYTKKGVNLIPEKNQEGVQ